MESKEGIRSDILKTKAKVKMNSNIIIFAFFLLLSFIFWYLNSLGEDLDTDIRYPVQFSNIPENINLSEDLPAKLTLFIKGPGFSILRLKMSGKKSPVIIDLTKVPRRSIKNNNSNNLYILTSGLVIDFNTQLKTVCIITSVKPDTLFYSSEQIVK